MQLTVALTLEVDATCTIEQLETQIQQRGRDIMKSAMKEAIHHLECQITTCPHGHQNPLRGEGTKRRVLLTGFGRVELALRRLRCQHCGLALCS